MKWPGFVEFDDLNEKVLTYSVETGCVLLVCVLAGSVFADAHVRVVPPLSQPVLSVGLARLQAVVQS